MATNPQSLEQAVAVLRSAPPKLLENLWAAVPNQYDIETEDVQALINFLAEVANYLEGHPK